MPLIFGAPMRDLWGLDPDVDFLNHGSFGATPLDVLAFQREVQDEMERQPVHFMMETLPGRLRAAADDLGSFIGAKGEDVVFVPNATTGVNAVLRSLKFKPGNRVITTNHVYGAVHNTLRYVCKRAGAELVWVEVPFPIGGPEEVLERLEDALKEGAALAVLDHITSSTGLVLPIEAMVRMCHERGVPVLVDGAHAPGQVDLNVESLGAEWYTGNCHKWMLAPKGCAFLWAAKEAQVVHPTTISHGYEQGFTEEFDWVGTQDFSPYLSVTECLYFLRYIDPQRVRNRNRGLAQMAAQVLSSAWSTPIPSPMQMRASMVTMDLPVRVAPTVEAAKRLHDALWERHRIEVVVTPFGDRSWLRISAQMYNDLDQYDRLASAVLQEVIAVG
jgi:isopenicillin-N epimerase